MQFIHKNKIVIFGAGKIGRSFIGQLFSVGGYEVVFVDVYKPIIIAENMRNADEYFHQQLSKHLPVSFPLDRNVGLIDLTKPYMVIYIKTPDHWMTS